MPTLNEHLNELQSLMEASPERDAKFRTRALGFLRRLRDAVAKPDTIEDMLAMKHPKTGGLAFPAEWIDRRYKDLMFLFVPKGKVGPTHKGAEVTGGFGSMSGGRWKAIILPALMSPFNPEYLSTRINADSFVHEFIHYLDEKRFKKSLLKDKSKDARRLIRKGGYSAYYNDPAELNAHYQQMARGAESLLKGMFKHGRPPAGMQRAMDHLLGGMRSPQSFTAAIMAKAENKDFIEALEPKNRKKIMIRLAGLYHYLKDKYMALSEGSIPSTMGVGVPGGPVSTIGYPDPGQTAQDALLAMLRKGRKRRDGERNRPTDKQVRIAVDFKGTPKPQKWQG